ncbi:hypothetical protein [Streptomyces sp. NPDC002547]
MKDRLVVAGSITFLLTLIAGSAWIWTSAPCGLWTFSKAGDMPARCLTK